jgi:hypothetical protein
MAGVLLFLENSLALRRITGNGGMGGAGQLDRVDHCEVTRIGRHEFEIQAR